MLTKISHGDAGALVVDIVDEVLRLRGRVVAATRHLSNGTAVRGVTHGLVLNAVVCAAEPPTVPRIARSLGYARQVIQRAADDLVDDGLVACQNNPHHKTAKCLVPTQEGRAAYAATDAASVAWTDRIGAVLGQRALKDTVRLLRLFRTAVEQDLHADASDAQDAHDDQMAEPKAAVKAKRTARR